MDVNLPGIDGLEATPRIVATNPSTAVIVLSTHSTDVYLARVREAGAVGFITNAGLGPVALAETWDRRPGSG